MALGSSRRLVWATRRRKLARLQEMPEIAIPRDRLRDWGAVWLGSDPQKRGDRPEYFVRKDSMDFGRIFDDQVGAALAHMLGGIPLLSPNAREILPKETDCVEVGPVRIVGGVRPQNFDVGYRPDGVRFAFDSKTLNDAKSIQKNYQNMINDLGTEATTVHIRFPYAVVAFLVAFPQPALAGPQRDAIIETLERLTQRSSPEDAAHKAEAMCLAIWDPTTGEVSTDCPSGSSPLRIERFSQQIRDAYVARYKGLPPHASD